MADAAPWHTLAATSAFAAELVALRARYDGVEPITERELEASALHWQRTRDRFVVSSAIGCGRGPLGCGQVDIEGAPVVVRCALGVEPCRLKLLAIERVLEVMVRPKPSEVVVRDHLLRADWQRLLGRLQAASQAGPGADVPLVGWVVKDDELTPSWIEGKRDGGWKAKALTSEEMAHAELADAADALVMALVRAQPPKGYELQGAREDRLARMLGALAGHAHVFARVGRELVKLEVERVDPEVAVEASGEGHRVVIRWGDTVVAGEPGAIGRWALQLDLVGARARVGTWTRRAHEAWVALRGAPEVPAAGTPELAETLLHVSKSVRVKKDAVWLGAAHEPTRAVVLRLALEGRKNDKRLVIEGRARPVPELGVMLPGDGEPLVPLRRNGKVAHVVRALERERDDVDRVAQAVGLRIDHGATGPARFDWEIRGLEPAMTLWQAIEAYARANASVTVEWRGHAPRLSRSRTGTIEGLDVRVAMKRDWLDLDGGYALDGGELPLRALLRAVRDRQRYVVVDEANIFEVGEALVAALAPLASLDPDAPGTSVLAAPLVAELAAAGATVSGPPEWLSLHARMAEAATLDPVVPVELHADLRPYQVAGYAWLARLAHWARGACLADDMGLGKTLQALALALTRKGPTLVVCPTSVVETWLRETRRFAPSLEPRAVGRGDALGRMSEYAFIITSWDLLVRHEARFTEVAWATVVLDEAHLAKNAATRRAQAARAVAAAHDATFVVALTGTPVENRPSELWSLFQVIAPGLLGSPAAFRETFARQIENGDPEAPRRLGRLIRPFVLRRTKAEVARELPPSTEVRVDVELSPDERRRYVAMRSSALAALERGKARGHGPKEPGSIEVLAALTRLRQLACHPRLVDPSAPESSSKLERLVELVSELADEGRKVLVFSQFARLLELVRPALHAFGLSTCLIDGATAPEARSAAVDRFQRGEADCFLLSLRAGGVGLNLTMATEVIHLDPWWNPAVEAQAAGRAHRIGQERPVTVYKMVALGTLEEQILNMQADKRALVDSVLAGTESAAPLGLDELVALLEEAPRSEETS